MKVAVLGGSFNPPHICHVFISCYVLATAPVEQVWFVPCAKHAFGKTLAPFAHRLAMCRLAAETLRPDRVHVSAIEEDRPGTSWTIDTVRWLQAAHPAHEFTWIIGSDVLAELDRWKDFDELRQRIAFLVIPRAASGRGRPAAAPEPAHPIVRGLRDQIAALERLDFRLPDISSTLIRECVKRQQPIAHLVPQNVAAYIRAHNLYED